MLRIYLIILVSFLNLNLCARTATNISKRNMIQLKTSSTPSYCLTAHNIGKINLPISNFGVIGKNVMERYDETTDCLTGDIIWIGCEYPKDSYIQYLYDAALWIGGIIGTDTLVSVGFHGWGFDFGVEFHPDLGSKGDIIYKSILSKDDYVSNGAVSEQDFIVSYSDTFIAELFDSEEKRKNKPLYLKVTQHSYAWSYTYAEDFILFNLDIENIGKEKIEAVYLGLFVDSDVGLALKPQASDDISGYININSHLKHTCIISDTLNIAWIADNDGDPYNGSFIDKLIWNGPSPNKSGLNILGLRILNSPMNNSQFNYNWWGSSFTSYYDFGPRHRVGFRDFKTGGLGTPVGDKNRYHILSNNEIDYDQIYTSSIQQWDDTWQYPNQSYANIYSTGLDTRFLLSCGPFSIEPQNSFSFVFALVAGENFHIDPNNINNLPHNPDEYMSNVDFSDLAQNAMWASWIYDNPGIDTDGDGFYGKYRVCAIDSIEIDSVWTMTKADTTFYEGDGVPDWRAAGPPPAPDFWLEPLDYSIRIRFNGERSETEKDFMTGKVDFEGYHLWMGRDERESSLSIIASYDIYNFDKYVFNKNLLPEPNYQLSDNPFTIEQLRCLYGNNCDDTLFNPLDYVRHDPYIHPDYPDSIFIFLPHHHNTSEFGITTPITKVYPNAINPNSIHPDSLTDDHYTEDGYFKYYEYQFIVNNLLPTVPYYFNVTSFDQGSQQTGLNPLESSKTLQVQFTYPLSPGTSLTDDNRKVYIYPNPYIINADYRTKRFEGRNREYLPNDKVRAIHFNNLPAKCVISIFSFDGDLVRAMTHDFDETDPNKLQHEWNLVNKNRQLVVSGIYYWTVEDHQGKVQMGKLVIIM